MFHCFNNNNKRTIYNIKYCITAYTFLLACCSSSSSCEVVDVILYFAISYSSLNIIFPFFFFCFFTLNLKTSFFLITYKMISFCCLFSSENNIKITSSSYLSTFSLFKKNCHCIVRDSFWRLYTSLKKYFNIFCVFFVYWNTEVKLKRKRKKRKEK